MAALGFALGLLDGGVLFTFRRHADGFCRQSGNGLARLSLDDKGLGIGLGAGDGGGLQFHGATDSFGLLHLGTRFGGRLVTFGFLDPERLFLLGLGDGKGCLGDGALGFRLLLKGGNLDIAGLLGLGDLGLILSRNLGRFALGGADGDGGFLLGRSRGDLRIPQGLGDFLLTERFDIPEVIADVLDDQIDDIDTEALEFRSRLTDDLLVHALAVAQELIDGEVADNRTNVALENILDEFDPLLGGLVQEIGDHVGHVRLGDGQPAGGDSLDVHSYIILIGDILFLHLHLKGPNLNDFHLLDDGHQNLAPTLKEIETTLLNLSVAVLVAIFASREDGDFIRRNLDVTGGGDLDGHHEGNDDEEGDTRYYQDRGIETVDRLCK